MLKKRRSSSHRPRHTPRSGEGGYIRRSQRDDNGGSGGYEDGNSNSKEMGVVRQTSLAMQPQATPMPLDRILLETTSAAELKMNLDMLASEIVQHVDNSYHLSPVPGPRNVGPLLAQAGYASLSSKSTSGAPAAAGAGTGVGGATAEEIARLLHDERSRRMVVRHLISWFVLGRIGLSAARDGGVCLLPEYIAALAGKFPAVEKVPRSREGSSFVSSFLILLLLPIEIFLLHPILFWFTGRDRLT